MILETEIFFIIVVPDWRPEQASPSQGFAPSLFKTSWAVQTAALMPANIYDWTDAGKETLLARRMSGKFPVRWYGQSPRAIRAVPWPDFLPFVVLVIPETESIHDYKEWLQSSAVRPVVIARAGGDLMPEEVSLETIQKQFIAACDRIPNGIPKEEVDDARAAIQAWKPLAPRKLGYQVGGHNTVAPNLMALRSAGFDEMVYGRFDKQKEGLKAYIEDIVRTTNSILDERANVGERDMQRIYREPPDVNLFAPGIYPHFFDAKLPPFLDRKEQRHFRGVQELLQRQNGYAYAIGSDAKLRAMVGDEFVESKGKVNPRTHPLMMLRAEELHLCTRIMGALAVSEFSAVVRMPNEVNRTIGAVRNFAQHYRSDNLSARKRLLAFRQVQERIAAAVPVEFIDLIRRSKSGVRVVADAHLEWLNIDGLPLCIRKVCSRIPITPGNMFVDVVSATEPLVLSTAAFKKVLVISALKQQDPIRRMFELAFEVVLPQLAGKLEIEIANVESEQEFVDAINNYDGPLIIFDGHGSHDPRDAGRLHLGDVAIDVWSLKGKIRQMAPIVVLSACDTHAADRNHATTANGFISLGARTVLASVFPLDARYAAVFTGRFLLRLAQFLGPAIKMFERAVTWSEVVSGMLRMQMLTDYLRQLQRHGLIDRKIYKDAHLKGNFAINGFSENPFEVVLSQLEEIAIDRGVLMMHLEMAVANSSVISYLQVGRPETILIDDEERVEKQLSELNANLDREIVAQNKTGNA